MFRCSVFFFVLITLSGVSNCQEIDSTSPELYDAVGDGMADDTWAVEQAINDASMNGRLLVSENTSARYLVKSTISIPANVNVAHLGVIVGGSGLNTVVNIESNRPIGSKLKLDVEGKGSGTTGFYINGSTINAAFELTAENCGVGIHLVKNIEACNIKAWVRGCDIGVKYEAFPPTGGSNRTPDENSLTIHAMINSTDFLSTGAVGATGNVNIFSEGAKNFSVVIENGDFVLGGTIRGAGNLSGGGILIKPEQNSSIVFDDIRVISAPKPGNWGLLVENPASLNGAIETRFGDGGVWVKVSSNSTMQSKLRITQHVASNSNSATLPALRLGTDSTSVRMMDVSFGGFSHGGPAVDLSNCEFCRIDLTNNFDALAGGQFDCVIGANCTKNTIVVGRKNWQRLIHSEQANTDENVVQYIGSYRANDASGPYFNGGVRFKGMQIQHHKELLGTVFWDGNDWVK